MTGAQDVRTVCPHCGIRPPLSGEPNCYCDPYPVQDMYARLPQTHTQVGPRLWTRKAVPIVAAPEVCPVERPQRMESKPGTVGQLHDLPDILTHLALRLTSSEPGAEAGGRKDPQLVAPVNVGVLQALDERRRYGGDDILGRLDEERWRCTHRTHAARQCPWEPDSAGRQGVLADLDMWADWILGDLEQWHPALTPETPMPPTYMGTCGWLAEQYPRWAGLRDTLTGEPLEVVARAVDEFEREVARWHTQLRHELGETDPVPLRHSNLGGCGGRLLPLSDGIRHECVDCHEVLTPGEMLGLARWQSDVTLADAAEQLGYSVGQIRQWAKRDKEGFPRPVDDSYPAKYLLRDVRDYALRRAGKSSSAG